MTASGIGAVRCLQVANAVLGESPSWDAARQVLYWADIQRPAIFRWDHQRGQTGHWPMPQPLGCVVATYSAQHLVFADANGFGAIDLGAGQITRMVDPECDLPGNRFNDGKVDRRGRLWSGTLDSREIAPTGSLYRLDHNRSVHRMATGFICSNGLGWSPDDRTMYFTDSMVRKIWAYEFHARTGELGERRVFASFPDDGGVPDGLTVDAEGFIWSAIWDGWRVIRFRPDGTIDREVRMPVQRPTSCMFGGSDLRTLYVTSASTELDCNALACGPLAGALFALQCDVPGLPETPFGLESEGLLRHYSAKENAARNVPGC